MKYKALLFSLFATANLFAQHPAIHFEIETDQPCQTMDYFGASDCWAAWASCFRTLRIPSHVPSVQ